jgi:hypothetical protein
LIISQKLDFPMLCSAYARAGRRTRSSSSSAVETLSSLAVRHLIVGAFRRPRVASLSNTAFDEAAA